ncbi:MAG: hypothetical protein ACXWWD_02725 [Chitinophagaceae bacterium]
MTHRTKSWLLASVVSLISMLTFGQRVPSQQERHPKFPGWVSDKGYWVVESNINSPLDHIITFYNNDNELLYKETVTGVKLNPEKRKVKMKLKRVLESVVLAWEKKKDGQIPGEEMALVKAVFY